MTRKNTAWYPGKPGPTPTGLNRTIAFPLMLSKEEWEHLERLERKSIQQKDKKKKAQIIRERVFHRHELDQLRYEQGANIG